MTDAQAGKVIELLAGILAELQSWKAPLDRCQHPPEMQRNMSTMGNKHIQCGACGADLIGREQS